MIAFNFGIDTNSNALGTWQELAVFSAYRLFLLFILFGIFHLQLPPYFLG